MEIQQMMDEYELHSALPLGQARDDDEGQRVNTLTRLYATGMDMYDVLAYFHDIHE